MAKSRSEMNVDHCWSVSEMVESNEIWEKSFEAIAVQIDEAKAFVGVLKESPSRLKEFLLWKDKLSLEFDDLYTYIHLKHDEDTAVDAYKSRLDRCRDLGASFSSALSFFEPELLAMDKKQMDLFLDSTEIESHKRYLERILLLRDYVLSEPEEKLLSSLDPVLSAPEEIFRSFNDTDISFPELSQREGEGKSLSHGTYYRCLIDPNRELREEAYRKYLGAFEQWPNLLCTTLSSSIKTQVKKASIRKYSCALEASLKPREIDLNVYSELLKTVKGRLGVHHRYLNLRKKSMGLKKLQFWDIHVPIVKAPQKSYSIEEASQLLSECLSPLGHEYVAEVEKGLTGGWVDWLENKNKRSGAYSSGCYSSKPYILMNFDGTLNSVFTLAHEVGHSMHSLLSSKNQSYTYSHYPIFLAEVASTFNERLLMKTLRAKASSPAEQIYLVNHELEQIRNTFIRQALFADFELAIHREIEEGRPLTSHSMKEIYGGLIQLYFSDAVEKNDLILMEWARIPHFYYNFYVYQYSTGFSAATCLSEKVLNGTNEDREAYLGFLKSGSSHAPIDTLKKAGVDMMSSEPAHSVMDRMDELLNEFEALIKEMK